MAVKFIAVVVTKEDSTDYSPAKTRWIPVDRLDDLQIGNANGATFKYTPLYSGQGRNYETSTAASTIFAALNA